MPVDQQAHASWAEVYDQAYETIYGGHYQKLTEATLELVQQSQLGGPPKTIIDFGGETTFHERCKPNQINRKYKETGRQSENT